MDPQHYISVCLELGSTYIDLKLNEQRDPYWTMVDLNDRSKVTNQKQNKFKIIKNGIHFVFNKGF